MSSFDWEYQANLNQRAVERAQRHPCKAVPVLRGCVWPPLRYKLVHGKVVSNVLTIVRRQLQGLMKQYGKHKQQNSPSNKMLTFHALQIN